MLGLVPHANDTPPLIEKGAGGLGTQQTSGATLASSQTPSPPHRPRGSLLGQPAHRPQPDTALLATHWYFEVFVSFDHGRSVRALSLPEC
jgi:hypothetical protein